MSQSITMIILVFTTIVSFLSFNNPRLMDALIFWPPAISMRRQYYRFLTCGFIHANLMHLAFNMLTLFFFGRGLELFYMGRLGLQHYYFTLLYLSAIVVANIPSYLKQHDNYNYRSLGASGGVCAVLFAFILIDPWKTLQLFFAIDVPAIVYAVLFLAYTIYMSRRGGDNVNHDAHLWGAIYGIIFTIIARPSVVNTFLNELLHPRFNLTQ
jgi:membrane associated rhomboid family serine protease